MAFLKLTKAIACAVLLATLGATAPAAPSADSSGARSSSAPPSSTASAAGATETVPYASDNPNDVLWGPNYSGTPEAVRGSLGASVIGPQNVVMDMQNPDMLAPPSTDSGSV